MLGWAGLASLWATDECRGEGKGKGEGEGEGEGSSSVCYARSAVQSACGRLCGPRVPRTPTSALCVSCRRRRRRARVPCVSTASAPTLEEAALHLLIVRSLRLAPTHPLAGQHRAAQAALKSAYARYLSHVAAEGFVITAAVPVR